MKVPKAFQQATSQAQLKKDFELKMKAAQDFEEVMEKKVFEYKDEKIHIRTNGHSKVLLLTFLSPLDAEDVMHALNLIWKRGYDYRMEKAKEIIGQ